MNNKGLEDKRRETLNIACAWKCTACCKILGYTDPNKEILRIKYKDLYIYVKGGEVTEICRYCGKANTAVSSDGKRS